MSLEWEQVVVATRDPVALGRWLSGTLGWVIVKDDPVVFEIQPKRDGLPGILFLAVDEAKRGRNRLHIDLRPNDQSTEVERLIGMRASRIDVGQATFPGWFWSILRETNSAFERPVKRTLAHRSRLAPMNHPDTPATR